jgi:hypothetical protein
LTDDQIKGSSFARVNGRFPALAYYNKTLDIAIWRSSELEGSVMGKRNLDDENFLKEINHLHD